MFSSSIFLGALFGAAAAQIAGLFIPGLAEDRAAIMLVSMGAVAAGIVGAPMTMVFLVLEGTGNFGAAVDVMVGVVVSSTIVRDVFGYSFSTWRFHERGLSIRGGHDVGWLADMTVGTLMRRDPIIVSTAMPLKELRNTVPVGGQKFVLAMDSDGHFAGVVDMARAHDAALNEALDTMLAGDLTANAEAFLRPSDNVRDAFTRFASSRQEMLPVIHPARDAGDRRLSHGGLRAAPLHRGTRAPAQRRARRREPLLHRPTAAELGLDPAPLQPIRQGTTRQFDADRLAASGREGTFADVSLKGRARMEQVRPRPACRGFLLGGRGCHPSTGSG